MTPDKLKQRNFLLDIAIAGASIEMTMRLHGVDEGMLFHWMRSRSFRKRLLRLRTALACRRELEVSRGAVRAAERLAAAVIDDATDAALADIRRKIMVDLIRLSRWRPPSRRASLQGDSSESDEPLIAGNVSEDDLRALGE